MAVDPIILEIRGETKQILSALAVIDKKVDGTEAAFEGLGEAGEEAFDKTGKASDKATKKVTTQDKAVKRLESGYKTLERRILAAFAIDRIVRFTAESIKLAGELQGVEAAFNRISTPGLLDELRDSTRGTVSDLELMKQAVRANNFQIPLTQLGSLFEFARRRAKETGEEVDFLVNSIIAGIGRKSPLILDNLGISAVRLRKELKGVGVEAADVGDIAAIIGKIAEDEMTKMGDEVETTKDRTDALNASFKNMQAEIGQILVPAVEDLLGVLTSLQMRMRSVAEIGFWQTLFGGYDPEQIQSLDRLNKITQELLTDIEQNIGNITDQEFGQYWDDIGNRINETIINTEDFNKLDEEIQKRLLQRIDGETAVLRLKRDQLKATKETNDAEGSRVGIIKQLKDEIAALNKQLPNAKSQNEVNQILDARNRKEHELKQILEEQKIVRDAFINQEKNLRALQQDEDEELQPPTFPENPFTPEEMFGQFIETGETTEFGNNLFRFVASGAMTASEDAEKTFDELYDHLFALKMEADFAEIDLEKQKADEIKQVYEQRLEAITGFFGALNQLMRASGKNSKELAGFQALLNFYLAISNALAQPLDPVTKAIYVATITAQAAAQLTAIQGSEPPSFYKGTPFFNNSPSKGRKKDDGWARLHYGEAVIPADANKRAKGLSSAWIDGKENDWIYTNHILPAIINDRAERKNQRDKSFAANIARGLALNMPDDRMVRELKKNRMVSELLLDEVSKRQNKNPFRA